MIFIELLIAIPIVIASLLFFFCFIKILGFFAFMAVILQLISAVSGYKPLPLDFHEFIIAFIALIISGAYKTWESKNDRIADSVFANPFAVIEFICLPIKFIHQPNSQSQPELDKDHEQQRKEEEQRKKQQEQTQPKPDTQTLKTVFLTIKYNLNTNHIAIFVHAGKYKGYHFDDLSFKQLTDLLSLCNQHDPQGVHIVEKWLEHNYEDQWYAQQRGKQEEDDDEEYEEEEDEEEPYQQHTSPQQQMTPELAYQILGLTPNASPEDIKTAHRKLIALIHPDKGGTNFLAVQINKARDILLQIHK